MCMIYKLRGEININTISKEEKNKKYAALKMIQCLYEQGKIKKHIYKNIILENKRYIDEKEFL